MTRKEVIEKLRIAKHKYMIYNNSFADAIDIAVRELSVSEWIAVEDRLPETEEDFLCIDADENYEVGCYSSNFKHFFFNSCSLIGKPIAWMRLPEPYKEQTERSE